MATNTQYSPAASPAEGSSDVTYPQGERTPLDRFLTLPHSVPKFLGLEDSTSKPLGPHVLPFLEALETHFLQENITTDIRKIAECKRFIHPDRGNAHHIVLNKGMFKHITTWKAFSERLRLTFGVPEQQTPQALFSEILHLEKKEDEPFQVYLSQLERLVEDFTTSIDGASGQSLDPTELRRVLVYFMVSDHLRGKDRKIIRDNQDFSMDFIDLYGQKLSKENALFGHYPRGTTRASVRTTIVEPPTPRRRDSRERHRTSYAPTTAKREYQSPRTNDHAPFRCYNCQREGHSARRCRSQAYCPTCKQTGHRMGTGPRCSTHTDVRGSNTSTTHTSPNSSKGLQSLVPYRSTPRTPNVFQTIGEDRRGRKVRTTYEYIEDDAPGGSKDSSRSDQPNDTRNEDEGDGNFLD